MGEQSNIQWTEATWNPWHGCRKVSAGCKYCYMYRDKERYGQAPHVVMHSKGRFDAPLKWVDGRLIFTCSWSDWFIEEADAWREEAWDIIRRTPQHTYQILTKRPERIAECLPADWGEGYPNVWLGVSVESNAYVERISLLAQVPAVVRFVSFEPLIGPIDALFVNPEIHWIIIGGESGNETGKYRYRVCKVNWMVHIIRSYMYQSPRTKIFVKQMGTHLAKGLKLKDRHGGDIREWPKVLKRREMPEINKVIQTNE